MMAPNYMQVGGLARALGARGACVAARRCDTAARAGAPDLDAAGALVTPTTRAHPDLQSEQPDRRAPDGGGAGRDLPDRRRRHGAWVAVGRDLPRRRARRRRDADRCGAATSASSSRAGCRRPTGCRACGSAGSSAPPDAGRRAVGRPRLHDDRAGRDQRSARADRAGAARARAGCSRARAASCSTNYPIVTRLDRTARRRARRTCRRRPAPSCSSATRTRSTRPRLVERLRDEQSVLVVPGDHFEMDGYLRIGFGTRSPSDLVGEPRTDRRGAGFAAGHRRRCALTLALVGFGHVARRFAGCSPSSATGSARLRPRVPHRRHRDAPARRGHDADGVDATLTALARRGRRPASRIAAAPAASARADRRPRAARDAAAPRPR